MEISIFLKKHKREFYIGIIIGIATLVLPKEIISPFIIFFVGLGSGIFLISLSREQKDRDFLTILFSVAFLLRVFVALFVYTFHLLLKGGGLFGDGWCYSENGYTILQMWLSGIRDINKITEKILPISASATLSSFDFWNAFVYFFTGKSPLSLVLINCSIGSLTMIIIYYITKQLSNGKAAMFAAILTAFWPSLFLWSIQNFKEPVNIFLVSIVMWSIIRIAKKFKFYLVFLIIVSSVALIFLRPISFFTLYLIVIPFYLVLVLRNKIKCGLKIFIILFIIFISLVLPHLDYLLTFIPFPHSPASILRWAYTMRTVRVLGANSAFLVNFDFTEPSNLIIFTPLAFLYSLFAPFPWQWGSVIQVMAIPEMLIYYLLIPFTFSGAIFIIKNKVREGEMVLVYILAMFVVLAFLEGNVGTLFRHRALILPFMFVFIGIGLSNFKWIKT